MSKEAVFMGEQEFVSEKIGLEYEKQWGAGDAIFIDAPTGSGKSYFILHDLLKYAMLNGRKILYLVNRKVLKKQIQREIDSSVAEICMKLEGRFVKNYITVSTYQSIESQIQNYDKCKQIEERLREYSYIVYDECHYFYADSNFNTNTELSFDFLQLNCVNKVQIFISATLDIVENLIVDRGKSLTVGVSKVHHYNFFRPQGHGLDSVLKYKVKRRYDFVRIHTFNKQEDLKFIIQKNSRQNDYKWLIFTDSIKNGKILQKELVSDSTEDANGLSKDDVVFIDAGYEKENEAAASVSTLVEEGYINKKVIIATPVLDNGISFFDNQLRNIVILSDTEEEFIQMLGRKRKDEEKIDLYICKRSIEYFENRKVYVEKIYVFLNRYYGRHQYIRKMARMLQENVEMSNNLLMRDKLRYELLKYNQNLLNDILSDTLTYECARKVCYAYNGEILMNEFSAKRVMNLRFYYDEIIKKMEEDENAFLKMQMGWMNKSVEEIDEIVATTEEELLNQYRERLKQGILLVLDGNMSKEDCIEFKKKNKDLILYFLDRNVSGQKDENEKKELEKMKSAVAKVDRTLTDKQFNYCMERAELPYVMIKPDSSTYKIISELPEKM